MDQPSIESLLAAVPLPLVLIDADARLAAANAPALTLLGAAMLGRHHGIAIRQPGLLAAIEAGLRRGQPGQARYVVPVGAQEETYHVTVTPVVGAGRASVLCAFQNITEQEQIGQLRRDFVANVSHELRTPLTALVGFIETLKGAARDDQVARARFLDIMEREAGRMNRLVRDLLQLSKVEAGERQRPTERVDIAGLIRAVVTTLRPMADAAGIAVEITGPPGPHYLTADPDQMTQVFQNLIENAVKYGAPGKLVSIVITPVDRDASLRGPALRVDVIDRGEGIDAQHLPRLTERFYRVDAHRSREKGGTGLGLAIVKHIVNRHRGRLRINSEKGRGSCFSVVLPAL
ncbi:MAG: ATP-binding protein [Pseudorhodobacter sp.]|nr:ATP-binding protein [Pseudorhodobacter sp.]